MTKIHDRIREHREQRNFSQDYMAAKLGISQNAYSRLELGQAKIQLDRALKIAELLEVSLISLLDLEDRQVFNIEHNQTVNGNVTNQGIAEKERVLFEKLLTEKDSYISQLKDEVTFLRALVKQN